LEISQTDIHRDIIEQCKAGERNAQYRLYSLYAKAMYNITLRMMHSREEAEDMLQDAFTEAFRRLDSFRYESSFGSWLKRIVINRCINELQKRKAELAFFDDMETFDGEEEHEDTGEYFLTVERVKEAMKQLPEGSRVIFSLYLLEGYDHEEIGSIMHISESTSKTQFMRAKNKLREILGKRYEN
jgi:RNA polymerase sigma-70 factor (ECF subfamily)